MNFTNTTRHRSRWRLVARVARDSLGVSNVEYIVLLGVVALLAIAAFRKFGGAVTQVTHLQGEKVRLLEGSESQETSGGRPAILVGHATNGKPAANGTSPSESTVISRGTALALSPTAPTPRPVAVLPAGEIPGVAAGTAAPSPAPGGATPPSPPVAPPSQTVPPANPPGSVSLGRKLTEIAAGAGLGAAQAVAPGGVLANAIPTPTRYTEFGRGLSELGIGAVQFIAGLGEMGTGGTAVVGGILGAPETGGLSLGATAAGGVLTTAGAATAAQGMSNVAGSFGSLYRAVTMPEEPAPAAEPQPEQTPKAEPKPQAEPETASQPKVNGEKPDTIVGKEVHQERATARRASGEWDEVNTPTASKSGEPIEVPKKVNLKTGEPVGSEVQKARPDAVSYKRGQILDDKPVGRPISKDRQEIIRFIKAYEERTGAPPKEIVIERYDPATGKPVATEIYKPGDFLPGPKK